MSEPMPLLPDTVEPYKRTPTFTQETVPAGLLKEHRTKAGTWGVLTVASGSLSYHITETDYPCEHILDPGNRGVIVPEQGHHIALVGEVSFFIEFYR